MHILLTGARGYIGSRLLELLRSQGVSVTVLGQAPSEQTSSVCVFAVPWRLGQAIPGGVFDNERVAIDAVIHLAHDWNTAEGEGEPNQTGTSLLLEAARAHGVKRFVFVSSMSARPDAPTRYGRIKSAIEGSLQGPGETAGRLGLVYGGPPRGLYGTMLRLTRLPLLPMIDAAQQIQPIHLDEVCFGLITMARDRTPAKRIYRLAADKPMSFGTFLRILARVCHERRLRLLPIPRLPALWAADLSAKLPFLPTVDRERVLGLAGIRVQASADDLAALNLAPVPVETGLLTRSMVARRVLREGAALLHYCAGAAVNRMTVRLYARSLRQLGDLAPLELPGWALRWPPLLRLLDDPRKIDSPLRHRLGIAARVAEAGPEPVERFHMVRQERRLAVVARLGGLMLSEGVLLAVRTLSRARERR